VQILSSYQQIMHQREAAMKLHIGDIFLEKFPPSSARMALQPEAAPYAAPMSASEHRIPKKQRNSVVSAAMGRASHDSFSPAERSANVQASHVHLRSCRLHQVKIGYSKAVEKIFLDFGLPAKPLFATEELCAAYDELRNLSVRQLDSKKKRS
jgi:hypothetical protein